MKLSEMFGGNKNIATINFMCQQQGVTMPEREQERIETMLQNGERFFVFIGKSGLDVLQMRERSEMIGKIVSGRVMRGTVLFFHDHTYREITRTNLKDSWRLITPKMPILRNDRIPVPKRERTSFDEAMPDRPHKKFSRKGFLCTMIANESMDRISCIL